MHCEDLIPGLYVTPMRGPQQPVHQSPWCTHRQEDNRLNGCVLRVEAVSPPFAILTLCVSQDHQRPQQKLTLDLRHFKFVELNEHFLQVAIGTATRQPQRTLPPPVDPEPKASKRRKRNELQ